MDDLEVVTFNTNTSEFKSYATLGAGRIGFHHKMQAINVVKNTILALVQFDNQPYVDQIVKYTKGDKGMTTLYTF